MSNLPAYGHWQLVIFNSLFMLVFVFAFFKPTTRRDWRTFGTFSAFVVALFTEMYGFPLTVYLLSGWLGSRFPEINWFSHNASHLLQTLLGWEGDAHAGPLHLLSNVLIVGGLFFLAASWRVLYRAQKSGTMASSGPYAKVRHPQYTAFMVIMIGFLIQWPTLPTLLMFPFLTLTYFRLAHREEQASLDAFGNSYARYMKRTPRFLPKIGRRRAPEADTL